MQLNSTEPNEFIKHEKKKKNQMDKKRKPKTSSKKTNENTKQNSKYRLHKTLVKCMKLNES